MAMDSGHRLKRDGIDGSGIDTLMADAGPSNGAFYATSSQREDRVANALVEQLRESFGASPPGRAGLEQIGRVCLSVEHRDNPEDDCPSAALLDEIGRSTDATKRPCTDALLAVIERHRCEPGVRCPPAQAQALDRTRSFAGTWIPSLLRKV